MQKALFLDRDGIFTSLADWGKGQLAAPRHWDEVRFLDDLKDCAQIKKLGYALILVTNQPDVGRGITPLTFVNEVNLECQRRFSLDAVYVCFDSDNSSPMKKPNPGMLQRAAADHSLDLTESFLLGDTAKDTGAARNAKCKSILWNRPYNLEVASDFRVSAFSELLAILYTP